jgi:hypothetical protein
MCLLRIGRSGKGFVELAAAFLCDGTQGWTLSNLWGFLGVINEVIIILVK